MAHNMFVGSGKRSGTRGGADQFSWDKVKADKYKDFYLGHSLHTTAKPTFNNRKPNPLWWTKAHQETELDDEARRRAEIEAIKREEEQLHLEALGLAPRRRKAQENQLDANEIQELTRRGTTERDTYDAERVAGLGYAPAPQHKLEAAGLASQPVKGQNEDSAQDRDTRAEPEGEWEEVSHRSSKKADEQGVEETKKRKRSKKEERKEERKEEKRRRKEGKERKRKKEDDSRTDRKERGQHSSSTSSDKGGRYAHHHSRRANDDRDSRKRHQTERHEHRDDRRRSLSPKRRERSPHPRH